MVKLGPDWKKNKWYRFAETLDGKDEVAYVNTMQIGETMSKIIREDSPRITQRGSG